MPSSFLAMLQRGSKDEGARAGKPAAGKPGKVLGRWWAALRHNKGSREEQQQQEYAAQATVVAINEEEHVHVGCWEKHVQPTAGSIQPCLGSPPGSPVRASVAVLQPSSPIILAGHQQIADPELPDAGKCEGLSSHPARQTAHPSPPLAAADPVQSGILVPMIKTTQSPRPAPNLGLSHGQQAADCCCTVHITPSCAPISLISSRSPQLRRSKSCMPHSVLPAALMLASLTDPRRLGQGSRQYGDRELARAKQAGTALDLLVQAKWAEIMQVQPPVQLAAWTAVDAPTPDVPQLHLGTPWSARSAWVRKQQMLRTQADLNLASCPTRTFYNMLFTPDTDCQHSAGHTSVPTPVSSPLFLTTPPPLRPAAPNTHVLQHTASPVAASLPAASPSSPLEQPLARNTCLSSRFLEASSVEQAARANSARSLSLWSLPDTWDTPPASLDTPREWLDAFEQHDERWQLQQQQAVSGKSEWEGVDAPVLDLGVDLALWGEAGDDLKLAQHITQQAAQLSQELMCPDCCTPSTMSAGSCTGQPSPGPASAAVARRPARQAQCAWTGVCETRLAPRSMKARVRAPVDQGAAHVACPSRQ